MTALPGGLDLRVALILQARMGSTRLPGKSMMDLAGAPLLARIIERVKRCTRPHAVLVATTRKSEDDALAELARDWGVEVFRGSENDLVDRYREASRAAGAEIVVRLPADNATPEPSEIDRIIDFHRSSASVFSTNLAQAFGNGYPDGIGAEVFDCWALDEVWRNGTDPRQREHVHLNFFDYATQREANPDRYPVGTIACPAGFARPDLLLDVNTPAQYEFMAALYRELYPRNPHFHITDIIAWYDSVHRRETRPAAREAAQQGGAAMRAAGMLVYCIDIDGTLCTNTEGDYERAEPFADVIGEINRLYATGHRIVLMTARGSTTAIDWRAGTERQLAKWGVRYHELHFGKPSADVYVDDKAINAKAWRRSNFMQTLAGASEEPRS